MTADVVITGIGAVTPIGSTAPETWAGALAGRSGVRALAETWADTLPVRIAARISADPAKVLPAAQMRRLDRSQALALMASQEAWDDAGLEGLPLERERLGVSFGNGIGGLHSILTQNAVLEQAGPRRVSLYAVPMCMANGSAAAIGVRFGARAGVHSVASACATGAEAVLQGRDIIRSGRADVVIAGATEAAVHPLTLAGFAAMRALSSRNEEPSRASRPWDKNRDGFVLGEAAAALILERADHAIARGARVYARLAGAGITSDGTDIVQPDPDFTGGRRAMVTAIEDAGLTPRDIGHVNAHATATRLGDLAEARGIRAVVGDHAVVSAPKSMLGHSLGAAGAVEAVLTVLALHHATVPPTINLDDPDDEVGLDIPVSGPRSVPIAAAMTNSFGFGGHNVALVLTRP